MATDAALGFRAHSGWAAAVAVSGSPTAPVVVDRRRLEIADPDDPDAKQPYHAAEPLDFPAAQRLIRGCTETSQRLARDAVGAMIADLRASGHVVFGCGLLQASGRPLPDLAGILASHALIHTAEGQMFRDVLVAAGRHHRLPVIEIRERELMARCTANLRLSSEQVTRTLAEIGRTLGPPWRQDEKFATLAAMLALAARR
jgi:hypothetical protein